jgi:peroxiredoxin
MAAPIVLGSRAPDFVLPEYSDKFVRLSDETKKHAVALLFFPSIWGVMCNVEMGTFRDMYQQFRDAGGELIGISTQSTMANGAYRDHLNLPFRLLSDFDGAVSSQYSVLVGEEGYIKGRANRAVFVVDRDMRVRYLWIAEDPAYEPDYDAVLAALRRAALKGSP